MMIGQQHAPLLVLSAATAHTEEGRGQPAAPPRAWPRHVGTFGTSLCYAYNTSRNSHTLDDLQPGIMQCSTVHTSTYL